MSNATITIRIDSELKNRMESVCADLGINMTTAFIMLAKKMVREQRIPFDVSIDPFYSESNMKHLREGAKELNAGRGVSHNLIEG
ncbi:MAG TPA: type II toxin-antitoxin system RelB/DinJ family antitoxin [Candidatus Aphodousia gallistercoris]|nr:type II toxin-antitoxin system RelB/DinJ family antitoxin [Candidatus Aphodousia gallistercoris]